MASRLNTYTGRGTDTGGRAEVLPPASSALSFTPTGAQARTVAFPPNTRLIRIVVEADTEIVIGDIAVQIDPTVANGAELIKAGVPEVRALGVTSGTIGLHFKLA